MSRARRAPGATRDRLLDAAAKVFLESGYDGARVVDIARAAGVTTGAIYANFRDKADLLVKALGAHGIDPAGEVLLAGSALPVAGMLQTLGRLVIEGALHPTEVLLLDAAAASRREPELRRKLAEVAAERGEHLAAVIERARGEGLVAPDVSTAALVRFLLIFAFGSIVTRTLGLAPPAPADWAMLLSRLLDGVAPRDATALRRRPPGPRSAARRPLA